MAQFIIECESVAPGSDHVVQDLIESLYEYGSGARNASGDRSIGPMVLMTAHRAKGLEFDHVLILDGGGWGDASDEERRLFYVAMTRARKTLTVCESAAERHAFLGELRELALSSAPAGYVPDPRLRNRTWIADPEQIVLSWPGYFSATAPIHKAIAALEVGSPLTIRPRSDGKKGWEVADMNGTAVARMAKKFDLPEGTIIAIRVAAILARRATGDEIGSLKCKSWELPLPEIEYLP